MHCHEEQVNFVYKNFMRTFQPFLTADMFYTKIWVSAICQPYTVHAQSIHICSFLSNTVTDWIFTVIPIQWIKATIPETNNVIMQPQRS